MLDAAAAQQIVNLLIAGDVQARTVPVKDGYAIEVSLEEGSRMVWGNAGQTWAFTQVPVVGNMRVGGSELASDAEPEQVAKTIATFDYQA